ncbi:MAG: UMP kinase, partial [Flavobacteriaceae bacterium]|nr:UMP kinase [Flavobacteriaceae bacterium]
MGQRFKRILLKLSGEYLGGQKGQGFDPETVLNLSELICQIQKRGIEIGIVLGGGNFFRGAKASKIKMNRVSGDQIGMLATVMNSMCLK